MDKVKKLRADILKMSVDHRLKGNAGIRISEVFKTFGGNCSPEEFISAVASLSISGHITAFDQPGKKQDVIPDKYLHGGHLFLAPTEKGVERHEENSKTYFYKLWELVKAPKRLLEFIYLLVGAVAGSIVTYFLTRP